MAPAASQSNIARTGVVPPLEWAVDQPSFEHAVALAKALFGDVEAGIVLIKDGGLWRSNALAANEAADARAIASQTPLWIAGNGFYAGAPIVLPNGAVLGCLSVCGALPRPKDRKLLSHLERLAALIAQDCERVRRSGEFAKGEQALRQSQGALDAFFQAMPIGTLMADDQMRILHASPKWLLPFGRTIEEVRGMTPYEVSPAFFNGLRSIYDRTLAGEHVIDERVRYPTPQGEWRYCTSQCIPWRDEAGNILGLIGVAIDNTAMIMTEAELVKARDEADAANQAKSAFLATMSHEIRTPLNGVLGMAQAMDFGELDSVQRERLSVIRQSGESLLAILNDVLDLAKIEAGKVELEMAPFDLADVARGAHAAFTELANRKGVEFALVLDDRAAGSYLGDSTRLRQIIYNLISNALKFTSAGEVLVSVERRGEDLRVAVTDTGIGVPADRLANLFQKFEQADASTTRRYGGTGLGLSICKELAELMGGEVSATSVEGQGSTFVLNVPMERLSDADAAEPGESAPAPEAPSKSLNLRVLAAEDNTVNQLVLKTLLHQIGVEPVIVADGAQALEAWRAGDWDVILMDVQMPVMDGPTATRQIREEEAKTGRARTPIIALTANAMAHQVAEYRTAGMDDFVAKPIEIGRLFQALEAALPEEDEQTALAS